MNGLAISLVSLVSIVGGYALLAFLWLKVFRETPERRERRLREEEALRRSVLGEERPRPSGPEHPRLLGPDRPRRPR